MMDEYALGVDDTKAKIIKWLKNIKDQEECAKCKNCIEDLMQAIENIEVY